MQKKFYFSFILSIWPQLWEVIKMDVLIEEQQEWQVIRKQIEDCLLYTSDAADE